MAIFRKTAPLIMFQSGWTCSALLGVRSGLHLAGFQCHLLVEGSGSTATRIIPVRDFMAGTSKGSVAACKPHLLESSILFSFFIFNAFDNESITES